MTSDMTQTNTIPAAKGVAQPTIDPMVILDQFEMGLIVADGKGQILYRNRRAFDLLPDGETLEATFDAVRFGADGNWRTNVARVLSIRCTMQWSGIMIKDPLDHLHVRCSPNCAPGAKASTVLLWVDVSKRSEIAEMSHDVGCRLASLGKLAAKVAHELNNPLDGVLRYVNLALRIATDAPEPKLTTYLSESRTGLMRMIRIIGELLEFSRNTDEGLEEAGVNEIVEQAIRACSSAADAGQVVVTVDFQSDRMPQIRTSRLYQVCCNLIRNAIDAMPGGGRVSIASGLIDECVIVRVSDTGAGLPDPVEKVFEPFYTTKAPGKGTGLGLAICKEFVEDMGGTINASNGDGGGAVFIVRIPMAGLIGRQPIRSASGTPPFCERFTGLSRG